MTEIGQKRPRHTHTHTHTHTGHFSLVLSLSLSLSFLCSPRSSRHFFSTGSFIGMYSVSFGRIGGGVRVEEGKIKRCSAHQSHQHGLSRGPPHISQVRREGLDHLVVLPVELAAHLRRKASRGESFEGQASDSGERERERERGTRAGALSAGTHLSVNVREVLLGSLDLLEGDVLDPPDTFLARRDGGRGRGSERAEDGSVTPSAALAFAWPPHSLTFWIGFR